MQVNALIYAMGDEADDIMAGFSLMTEERDQYVIVKAKFDSHFVIRQNEIFERAKFNRRCQEEGEMVDRFITARFCLAEYCEYGALNEEMIRDLSLKHQLDANLTLKRAIDMLVRTRQQNVNRHWRGPSLRRRQSSKCACLLGLRPGPR